MNILEAIVLGITQGLTEFLPISSSGHLILVPWLFGWEPNGLAFDASLHLGTLVAVFAYFWRDILLMVRSIPTVLRKPLETLRFDPESNEAEIDEAREDRVFGKLGLLIVIGSIPGGIAGLLAEDSIDSYFHDLAHEDRAVATVAALLLIFALVLWIAERRGRRNRGLRSLQIADALGIGGAQALALLPGVSRSGVTLTAGLFRGIQRADAARFSFLLGIPLISVAGLKGVGEIVRASPDAGELVTLAVGMMSAAVSGLFAIWVLLQFLQRASTAVFIAYRILVAAAVLFLIAAGLK